MFTWVIISLYSEEDVSGTEKWIRVVLEDLVEASTIEIIERVSMFNQDCADRIPFVLTQMRMDSKILYKVVPTKDGTRQNIVWYLNTLDQTE